MKNFVDKHGLTSQSIVPGIALDQIKKSTFRFSKEQHGAFLKGKNRAFWCMVVMCVTVVLTAFSKWHARFERQTGIEKPSVIHQPVRTFDKCFDVPAKILHSFDMLVTTWHTHGVVQNLYETRFQEHVWHTIINNAVFPTWHEYAQPLHLHDRALPNDLHQLRHLATVMAYRFLCDHKVCTRGSKIISVKIDLLYAHLRIDRLRGLQFALHFRTPSAIHKAHRSIAFSLFVQKPFDAAACIVALSNPFLNPVISQSSSADQRDDRPTIYILLPYHARPQRLRLFLSTFCYLQATIKDYHLVLVVSLLRQPGDTQDLKIAKTFVFHKRPSCASNVHVEYNDGDKTGEFSRSVALRQAATRASAPDNVLFQCDVDMIIRPGFFHRCVHNSIPGKQVYFPVFYSLYPYGNSRPVIMERNGFWRFSSFGMTCIRKRDFDLTGAFTDAETRFHGWGGEDIYQVETIRNASKLVAFRAVDPSLIHLWHLKRCDMQSDSYTDCMKTNFMTMGHLFHVGPVMLRSIIDVDKFFQSLQKL